MPRTILLPFLLALTAGSAAAQPPHDHPPTSSARLGTISFPTSASPSAQADFVRGVLYLHSFEYESAARAFRRAQELQPGFALAYWGEAMTYTHPVWNEQDLSAARAALDRLGPTPEARRAKAGSERERAYLGALELLYGSGSKARRDTLYAEAMERVVRAYPDDLEAKAFYALALLGLNQGVRDTLVYLRAARYADTVFRANPDHPGAAHYLIHSYDDPLHASQGLAAARAYAGIAPGAAHAQHMTTHIFLALGMWGDVVSQNRIAVAQTARLPGHYTSWLAYAMIQQGRYDSAGVLLEQLRTAAGSAPSRSQATALAEMRAHYLLHADAPGGPVAGWRLERTRMAPLGQLTDAFTDAALAFRRRDSGAFSGASRTAGELAKAMLASTRPGDPAAVAARVMELELEGMRLSLAGSREASLQELERAAAAEDAMPMEFGPPAIVEPSHELLGDLLLADRPSEALRHYRRALELAPGRSRALVGLIRAAIASGDLASARRGLEQLSSNWAGADPGPRALVASLRGSLSRAP